LEFVTFPKFSEGVFRVFRTFNLESGKISEKRRFRRFWKKSFQITGCPTYGPLLHEAKIWTSVTKKRILFFAF
jgi:hypothetical protein